MQMTIARAKLDHIRLCDACFFLGDGQFHQGTIVEGPPCFRCGVDEGIHVLDPRANDPRLHGQGYSVVCSTSLEMVPFPSIIWDVNGYYRELGVSPKATKKELRLAYQALNGHDSIRLTYIMSQLLDDEVRRKYDATPLGSMFRDDYVEDEIRKAKAQTFADLRGEGFSDEEIEALLDDGEIPDDWVVDTGRREDDTVPKALGPTWRFDYYVWQSGCEDREKLAKWQQLLISQIGARKGHLELAVGYMGFVPDPWSVQKVGYRLVVFLHHDVEPTDELAEQASSSLLKLVNDC